MMDQCKIFSPNAHCLGATIAKRSCGAFGLGASFISRTIATLRFAIVAPCSLEAGDGPEI